MSAQKCQELLTSLTEYACQPVFTQEMEVALELFSIATGKVFDDDSFFESRMALFQEYFLFDYRLGHVFPGSTVFETFLFNAQSSLSIDDVHDYESFRSQHLSLFIVEKNFGHYLLVNDLLACSSSKVFPLPNFSFDGFGDSQVFQGRAISLGTCRYFTGSFCFHPAEVTRLIEKHIRDFLDKLEAMPGKKSVLWEEELSNRRALLSSVAEQKKLYEQAGKKRPADQLRVSQHLAPMSHVISSPDLIMSLGLVEPTSVFVPEKPFYDGSSLIHRLAYCEVYSYRYKHIDIQRLYAFDNDETVRANFINRPREPLLSKG